MADHASFAPDATICLIPSALGLSPVCLAVVGWFEPKCWFRYGSGVGPLTVLKDENTYRTPDGPTTEWLSDPQRRLIKPVMDGLVVTATWLSARMVTGQALARGLTEAFEGF